MADGEACCYMVEPGEEAYFQSFADHHPYNLDLSHSVDLVGLAKIFKINFIRKFLKTLY